MLKHLKKRVNNPFLEAQRNWNIRILFKSGLFGVAVILNLILAVSNCGQQNIINTLSVKPKYLPYVVHQNDDSGSYKFQGMLESETINITGKMLVKTLKVFIKDIRMVSTDIELMQNFFLKHAYNFVPVNSAEMLTKYIRSEKPWEMAGKGIKRDIKFVSFLKVSESTWIANWKEVITTNKEGNTVMEVVKQTGSFTYITAPINDKKVAEENSYGILFTDFNISKEEE